ncbi:coproporphyrinogen III oxidase [Ferviditalea candida]|uniref:Coproporphyrinogen III oxidase n=1 Tax=Ferviditalea candida TaxID=3108399 RepID=A0ABU5ZHM8_9BACL|nr:coproporphyrinogen III oxidase [Paenibacillaceae bacterium T2]
MKFEMIGVAEQLRHSIENIMRLFFDEPELIFRDAAGPPESGDALRIQLKTTGFRPHGEVISANSSAELTDPASGKLYQAVREKALPPDADDKQRRREIRLSLSYALLQILQEWTGLEQPWGILTGVRPTKLLHRMLGSGASQEEAFRVLREQYLIHEEKIALMRRIVERQLSVVPDLYDLRREVSIYIGIPFCPTKCAYCTFPAYAINGRQGSVDSFLGGLHYEMEEIGRWLKQNDMRITTIYFGGGTPTSITSEEMDMLYERMYASFPHMDRVREITVEAGRPDTITEDKLDVLKKWGIGRISVNPQSYIQKTLDVIGRHHTVEETLEKFRLARRMGMNNINMDLIIGLPGEGADEFAYTLRKTEELMPESLTVHTLSFKRASEMTRNKHADQYRVAGRAEATAMMGMAAEWTNRNGYSPYYLYRQKNILGNLENVGYALPGRESIYNIIIMEEMQTIIGLGCGASSKWIDSVTGEISRFANPKEPSVYNEHYRKYTKDKIEALERLFMKKGIPVEGAL